MFLTRTNVLMTIFCLVIVSGVVAAANVTNLEEKLSVIDSLISHARKTYNIPGIAVGIVANGKPVFQKGYGQRDHRYNEFSVTPQTLFGIGSCSKPFTTFALDRMASEFAAVSWHDLVMTYIPEFRLMDDSLRDRMKIKDLVTHVSGLPSHEFVAYHSDMTRQELLARVAHLEATRDLREEFIYNNIMFTIAGIVLERVTSEPWERAMHRLVFEHLNMTRTFASRNEVRLAVLEVPTVDSLWDFDMANPHQLSVDSGNDSIMSIPWLDVTSVAPSGAIISCVEDMVKWIQTQLNLPNKKMEINMHTPQVVIPPGSFVNYLDGGETFAYGLGWMLSQHRDRRLVWHGGRIDGFITRVVLSPKDDLGVVILSNLDRTSGGHALHNLVLRILDTLTTDPLVPQTSSDLEAWVMQQASTLFPSSANPSSSGPTMKEKRKVDQPEQYAGSFTNAGYGNLEVYVIESKLFVAHNKLRYALIPRRAKDFFKAKSTTLGFSFLCSFGRDSFGDVSRITIDFEGPIHFKRTVSNDLYTVQYLRSFVGRYANDQFSVQFQVNEKRLSSTLVANGTLPYFGQLQPRKPNWFQLEDALFEFVIKNGEASEVRVHEDDLATALKKKS